MQKLIKIYLVLFAIALIVGVAGLTYIVNYLDPQESKANIVIFYTSLTLAAFSTCFFIFFYVRRTLGLREHLPEHFAISSRQAGLLTVFTLASFYLSSLGVFNWINVSILILALVFLESYFLIK